MASLEDVFEKSWSSSWFVCLKPYDLVVEFREWLTRAGLPDFKRELRSLVLRKVRLLWEGICSVRRELMPK